MPQPPSPVEEQDRLEAIARDGPVGAWALAGLATLLVLLIYLLFYVGVYLPRGAMQ